MARILEPGRNAMVISPCESAAVLVDAESYFRAFYQAASRAERSILLSGWQFDRDVALLRGDEAKEAPYPVTLLKFLNALCEAKPALEVRILAWDFNLVLAAEREWMQKVLFHWMTHERLRFRFDETHIERGCHHQKFVVIDGELSFVGGLDLCDHRWDDRRHEVDNPLRTSRGAPHQPFHDIQAYARGYEVSHQLSKLFACRWELAGGSPIPRAELDAPSTTIQFVPMAALPLPARRVAISRTDPFGSPDEKRDCAEIRELYFAAIARAEHLIYLETQYFSSHLMADAFIERMRDASLPKLEIVMTLNIKGETPKEQVAVGLAQAEVLGRLREVAEQHGHRLGVFYTLPFCAPDGSRGEDPHPTFVHAKVMIVDDRFITVGSANLTNRSMEVDTELNLSFEADEGDDALVIAIRDVRLALLAEHTGAPDPQRFALWNGLALTLERIARAGAEGSRDEPCRLRLHPSPTEGERKALALVNPQDLPFDPDEDDVRS